MKLTVSKSKFLQVIWTCSKAISWIWTLPVLSNILIEAKDSRLYCTSTDLDLTIQSFLDAEISEAWAVTLNARLFQSYLNLLADTEVDFSSNETDVSIKTKSSKTKFKWIRAEDFPKTLKLDSWVKISIPSKKLSTSISEVVFSVSSSSARPVLTWILLSCSKWKVSLTSTDSYRMSNKKIDIQDLWEADISVIIPSRTLMEVSRIISEYHAISSEWFNVFITVGENQVLFEIWDVKVYSRFIEWAFPNCKMLIPETHSTQIVIQKSDLLQAIKRLSIFAKEDNNKVKFSFADWLLTINTQTTQIWSDETILTCSISWDDIEVSLNSLFVLDILNALKKSEVLIEMNGNHSPVVFKNPWDDDWYVHIIMPLMT